MKTEEEIKDAIKHYKAEQEYWRVEAKLKDTQDGYSEYATAISREMKEIANALEWVLK